MTTARIYSPAKTAMQSGTAKTKSWVLDFEQASPKAVEPLMGWTSSSDMRQQIRLRFDTKDEAIAYCEHNGIPYRVFDPNPPKRRWPCCTTIFKAWPVPIQIYERGHRG